MTDIPAKPKAPLNPVFQFIHENREDYKKQNPDVKFTDLTKILSQKYQTISAKEKKKYEDKYKKAQEKYKKEKEEWESKY